MAARKSFFLLMATGCLLGLAASAAATWWTEDTMSTRAEAQDADGVNDTLMTASQDVRLDAQPNSGTGVIATNDDRDYYRLSSQSSGSHEFVRVRIFEVSGEWANGEIFDESYNRLGRFEEGQDAYILASKWRAWLRDASAGTSS